MKVLNFGSMNIDHTYELAHFVQPGETISSSRLVINCGGKGLNQSIALAKSGIPVYHAGMLGKEDGQLLIEELQKYGVYTQYIQTAAVQSGHAIIQLTEQGENSIILYAGANHQIDHDYIDKVISGFSAGDFCLLQNEISCGDYVIHKAHERGLQIVLNPSPYSQDLLSWPLHKVDYFILNEIEGEQMTGCQDYSHILDALINIYPHAKFILTLGSKGCVYRDKDISYSCEAFRTDVLDTTAAGDTFTGYFIRGILKDIPMDKNLKIASIAAAIAVSRPGAACSIPEYPEVVQAIAGQ